MTSVLSNSLEQEIAFFQAVYDRVSSDNGAKALLRRAIATQQRRPQDLYPILLPLLKPVKFYQYDIWVFGSCVLSMLNY